MEGRATSGHKVVLHRLRVIAEKRSPVQCGRLRSMAYARMDWQPRVRPFLTLCVFLFADAGLLPMTVVAETPIGQSPSHVVARLCSYSATQSTLLESRYVVDLPSTLVASEAPTVGEYGPLRVERKRADAQSFDRLEARIHEAGASGGDDDLSVAMKKIEKAKSWGRSPSDQLLASPDGNRTVVRPDFGIPLVVDLRTLGTQRIVSRSDRLPIPMAWSPDSRLLAFSPSETGTIVLYNVEQRAIQSTISTQGAWVQAIAWFPDMQKLVLLNLVNRRLHKTPLGLLIASSGHPDYRNDLVLQVRAIAGEEQHSVKLKSNLTEQSSYDYWIDWQ